ARSQCTLTAKWTYLAHQETAWQRDFFELVGLDDLFEHGNLPERASPVGAYIGPLTARTAAELGLTENCRVGAGVIDAYAGALGVLGGFAGDDQNIG
ncbi:ribulokinase, partial [Mesorhizobium sp. M00.F.Ca.ET.158.01.1.1]